MQKWGWGFISLALLIFITSYAGDKKSVPLSVLLFLIGLAMVIVSVKKEKKDGDSKDA
ncbi:hypothetical protein Hs30E_08470 [Lactococcus hodotermopsidis]|uniref:Uncharacterized protein n=1 Tax=Pseudolactococcus hodotermopsidis TaxID=2709157 RepID=A0A6A0BBT2_9LACT|nr:hypothetical protein [Lactococcus hodotermopsidis]GFH42296.1 hypothetical protein Hs30E_08470 [Lactococcus hodotermopsidis]